MSATRRPMICSALPLLVLMLVPLLGVGCTADGEDDADDAVPSPVAAQTDAAPADGMPVAPAEAVPAEADIAPVADASAEREAGAPLYTRLTGDDTGISHQNFLPKERQGRYLQAGAGVAAGDYDGDGWVDLYLVSEVGPNKLYRNRGDWRFEDVTAEAGVDVPSDVTSPDGRWQQRFSTGAFFFDYDDDGDLDLLVAAFAGANTLFRNEGDGTFTDVTEAAGLLYSGATTTAAFSDYDRDGDLDIYMATYRPYGASKYHPPELAPGPEPELAYDLTEDGFTLAEHDLFYRNNGDGTFDEVGAEVGVRERNFGLSAEFADVTGDGWPELYVATDLDLPDRFYRNNRDGTFSPMPESAFRGSPWFSMGLDFGDANNDGWLDLYTSDMMARDRKRLQTQVMVTSRRFPTPEGSTPQSMRNFLHLNNGDGTFTDVAHYADLAATEWTWTVKFDDADLDGWQDLLVTNGFVYDAHNIDEGLRFDRLRRAGQTEEIIRATHARPELRTSNFAFRNVDGLRFEVVSSDWGFDDTAIGHGLALADLDNDGDRDVVVNNMNDPVGVYRNDATANRLKVALRGRASNQYGLDARVTIEADGRQQTRVMGVSGGYMSSHEPIVVFGLGEVESVERLSVEWPSGARSVLEDVAANQMVTIREPEGEAQITAPPTPPPTQFERAAEARGLDYAHRESGFDDFEVQPLLPIRLSHFGPGVAWGDPDGDGWDDLYITGSADAAGARYTNREGQLEPAAAPEVPGQGLEERGPLWWPPGDGGADVLLTALSAVESAPDAGARPLARRSDDGWSPSGEASAGPLAAADYDGDGDLDVFVGGRARPDRYPLPADSVLFRNDDGVLVRDERADAVLEALGLVSGAQWTDADGDGDPDLVLATVWGPVRLLENDGGQLVDGTDAAGLAPHTGWWRGIASGDIDHDGDMDLVATNLGLNSRYGQPTADRPLVLYAVDADEDGQLDLIETQWDDGALYPLRGLLDLGAAIPTLGERFNTFQAFARANVEQVFGADVIERAERFEATTLAHTLFVNDGQGQYTARPLPDAAQLSTGFGVVVADLDNDGHDDVYLVGNFQGTQATATGLVASGVGAWLRGDGDGGFTAVPERESGLSVPVDARALAATDLDRDGWLDLAVGVNDGPAWLLHNEGIDGRAGLTVRLVGPDGNPHGVGARMTVTRADGLTMTREANAGGGYLSQSGTLHVFGLGDEPAPAEVTVRWPDGTEQTVTDAEPGTVVEVVKE